MFRLALVLFSLIATTMAGIGVVAALVMGHDTLWPILGAAGAGFVLSVPVTLGVARALTQAG